MMTRRKRLTIIVLILLLILLLIFFVWRLLSRGPEVVEVPEPAVTAESLEPVSDRPTITQQALEVEREERVASADVLSLSKTFVARYGSYSNEANFANLSDVLPLMSEEFAAQTRAFIASATVPEEYYGVSTQVITVKVDEEDEVAGVAQVTMTTQREEATGSPQNTSVIYQDIVLTFVKEGEVWKVDSATWQ